MTDYPHEVMAAFLSPSGKQGGCHHIFLWPSLGNHTLSFLQHPVSYVGLSFSMWRRLHKDTGKWESLGTILKAGYHMVLIKEESLIHN